MPFPAVCRIKRSLDFWNSTRISQLYSVYVRMCHVTVFAVQLLAVLAFGTCFPKKVN